MKKAGAKEAASERGPREGVALPRCRFSSSEQGPGRPTGLCETGHFGYLRKGVP